MKISGKIIVFALIAMLAFLVLAKIGTPSASVISVDEVTLTNEGEFFLVSAVVDHRQVMYHTIPKFSKIDEETGKKLFTYSEAGIRFIPKQATCEYSLKTETVPITIAGIPIGNVTYYVPNLPAQPKVPFTVYLHKDSSFVASEDFENIQLGETLTIDSGFAGPVTVSSLGALRAGYDCPPPNFAVLEGTVVDRSLLVNKINDISTNCINNPSLACVDTFLRQVPEVAGMPSCDGECSIGYNENLVQQNASQGKFVYNNQGWGSAFVTVTFGKDFVDGIILEPLIIIPKVEIIQDSIQLKTNQNSQFTASIANESGWDGAFRITTTISSNRVAISPKTIANFEVPAAWSRTQTFSITGLTNGTDQVCVKASSADQFGGAQEDEDCLLVSVSGTQEDNCGNDTCEWWWPVLETNGNCPEDCEPENGGSDQEKCGKGELASCKPDGLFITGCVWSETTPPWWGLFLGQIGTTTQCLPQYNLPLIVFGIVLIVAFTLLVFVATRRR